MTSRPTKKNRPTATTWHPYVNEGLASLSGSNG